MKTLKNYVLGIIANHSVINFVDVFLASMRDNCIEYDCLCFGDAGFLLEDKKRIENYGLRVIFVDMPEKFTCENIVTQDKIYRRIISSRIWFLQEVHALGNNRVVSLDADTAIISNDFSLLDMDSDLTLTVRDAGPGLHVLPIRESDYPNCGVVFYHDIENCLPFFQRWMWCQESMQQHPLTFEQWYFYKAMQYDEFSFLDVQKIHCRFYNCYEPNWINDSTSIIHFKSHQQRYDFKSRVSRFRI